MKLEKLSDTRIRCTLNKDDLNDRELRISELAYGSEKAKALFRDMMQQASFELGFEADDIPLMIEAIPISPDCLILDITKVEDPDELDTRFSNFTPSDEKNNPAFEADNAYADEILNCFEHISEIDNEEDAEDLNDEEQAEDADKHQRSRQRDEKNSPTYSFLRFFSFQTFKEICSLAKILVPFYKGENTLYKNKTTGRYYLCLMISNHSPEEFNKVCNITSEFGRSERASSAALAHFNEHYEVISLKQAVQVLSKY